MCSVWVYGLWGVNNFAVAWKTRSRVRVTRGIVARGRGRQQQRCTMKMVGGAGLKRRASGIVAETLDVAKALG